MPRVKMPDGFGDEVARAFRNGRVERISPPQPGELQPPPSAAGTPEVGPESTGTAPGLPAHFVSTQNNNLNKAQLAKVKYTHEAMADAILQNPAITQRELGALFGYTEQWVGRVIASDAFQAFIAKRKDEIVDPVLRGAVEESMRGLVMQSIEKLSKRLAGNPSDDLLLGVLQTSSKALGYGARVQPTVQIQQNFVAVVPEKAESTAAWAERVAERGAA